MVNKTIMASTSLFYESLRNRYNQLTLLREDDYLYNTIDGTEWKILEDGNKNGIAKSICTYVPSHCEIKLGDIQKISFYDELGKIKSCYKRGLNPNRSH